MKGVLKKTYLFIAILLFSGLTLISCSDDMEVVEDRDANELNIFFGSFGGLCGYADSMSISMSLDVGFTLRDLCTETDFENESLITQEEYSSLVDLLSISNFIALDFNSCDRCVDGLDTFLHIDGDDFTHRIVYGFDEDISSINGFVVRLNQIRESLKPQ